MHVMRHLWQRKRRSWVVLGDLFLSLVAYLVANLIRFDGDLPARYWGLIWQVLPALVVIRLACFTAFGLYRGVWAYASISDLVAIAKAVTVGSVALWAAVSVLPGMAGHSRGVLVIDWLLLVALPAVRDRQGGG